jgi:hypothetical protein
MSTKFKDMTGQRFGRLTVVRRDNRKPEVRWLCVCDCGNEVTPRGYALRSGKAQSCGCRAREIARDTFTKHGMHDTRIYSIWANMLARCSNPSSAMFKHYGGRGIYVCERWHIFDNFHKDMGVRPEGRSLDRIDNNGPYGPTNCRWADKNTQSRNRRRLHLITFNGQTKIITDWAKDIGIQPSSLSQRLKNGWPLTRALTEPAHKEMAHYGR